MSKSISFQNIFLIDALGALTTTILLSQVLARFESVFGMPREILYLLALIAALFAIYSFWCHWRTKVNRIPYLKGIALANTLYCILTLGLVIHLHHSLTWLGTAYFIGEIIIVMGLVLVEIKLSYSYQ